MRVEQIGNATLYCGDALHVLKTLPDGAARCCVTSPPYFGLRDYGCVGQLGLEATPDEYSARIVEVFREVRRVLTDDGTLWLNIGDSYSGSGKGGNPGNCPHVKQATNAGSLSVRAHVRNPLKAKDLIGIPWMLAFALRADGWYLRQEIIWHKPAPMPESVQDRCTKAHEQIFLLTKSPRYYFDAAAIAEPVAGNPKDSRNRWDSKDYAVPGQKPQKRTTRTNGKHSTMPPQSPGHRMVENVARARAEGGAHDSPFGATRNRRSVWTVATHPYPEAHFATFPPALIEPCIRAGSAPGDVVLDPFAGAGTTGLVASRLSRRHIGIELNDSYVTLAAERIRADAPLFAGGAA